MPNVQQTSATLSLKTAPAITCAARTDCAVFNLLLPATMRIDDQPPARGPTYARRDVRATGHAVQPARVSSALASGQHPVQQQK